MIAISGLAVCAIDDGPARLSFEAPKVQRRAPLRKQVLAKLPLLQQLGVHGCPLTGGGSPHPAPLLEALPLVEILDGKRVRTRIRRRLPGPHGVDQAARSGAAPPAALGGELGPPSGRDAALSSCGAAPGYMCQSQ